MLAASAFSSFAQTGLKIGDKVPEVTFKQVMNHSSRTISLSDYKDRLVIIDFWATWCSPCIAQFPKMDSLQAEFEGQIQIIPVTYEDRDPVEKLLERSPRMQGVALPIVYGEEELHRLFPHRMLPHYVWIDGTGKVRAITGSEEVTGANIKRMLGQGVALTEKRDVIVRYDKEKPLIFSGAPIKESDVHYQTLFTSYIPGLSSRMRLHRYEGQRYERFSLSNFPIIGLFSLAFSWPDFYFDRNRVILEVKDSSELVMANSSTATREEAIEWARKNTFCYEIQVPYYLSENIFAMMRTDLEALFPEYSVSLEKRNTRCLALVRTSSDARFATRGGKPSSTFVAYGAKMRNSVFGVLLSQLNGISLQNLGMPIIDATGYSGRIDLQLDCILSDVESLRRALQAYDLDLVEREEVIDMLVFKDAE